MHRSFIFSSETPRTVRKLLTLAVMVIITLVLTDWLVGRLIPYITIEPPFILPFQSVPGVEALWAFSDAGIQPIVFTGSSQTYTGISPHIFNDRIETLSGQDVQSVNVSILGSVTSTERDLIANLIIPNKPKVIFYGIEMRAVKPEMQGDDYIYVSDFKNKALGYAVTQPLPVERDVLLWLLKHSNLVRYRDNFHEWLSGTREINQGDYFLTAVDDLGHVDFNQPFNDDPVGIKSEFIPFTVTDYTKMLVTDIGRTCKESGVQCILLNMPIHQLAYQYITPAEEALYRQLIKQATLPIWDFNTEACRAILGDQDFFNLNHLNSTGAEVFTQMVADMYAKVFFNVAITGNATCAALNP